MYDGEKIISIRRVKEVPTKEDVIFGPTFIHPTIMMRKEVYEVMKWFILLQFNEKKHMGF